MILSCDALKFVHNVKTSAARNRDDSSILVSLTIMEGSISFTVIDENDFNIVGLRKNGKLLNSEFLNEENIPLSNK